MSGTPSPGDIQTTPTPVPAGTQAAPTPVPGATQPPSVPTFGPALAEPVPCPGDTYTTPPQQSSPPFFPSLSFYRQVAGIVYREGSLAKVGNLTASYTGNDWVRASLAVVRALEGCGVRIEATGLNVLDNPGPCVFIGNHMSTLETFVLPCLIQPRKDVTFVVKQSLLTYPGLGHVLCSRRPVAVSRVNPREDLTAVLEQGTKRLGEGTSIVVFPQSTRSPGLDLELFNSIGVKLARRAGVPVVPVALRTDAWGTGGIIKDLGRIHPSIPVRFAFGESLTVTGNGKEEHKQVCDFIAARLQEWAIPQLPPA